MNQKKIAISIEEAVVEKLERLNRSRLAEECAKLDSAVERKMADEGLAEDLDSEFSLNARNS